MHFPLVFDIAPFCCKNVEVSEVVVVVVVVIVFVIVNYLGEYRARKALSKGVRVVDMGTTTRESTHCQKLLFFSLQRPTFFFSCSTCGKIVGKEKEGKAFRNRNRKMVCWHGSGVARLWCVIKCYKKNIRYLTISFRSVSRPARRPFSTRSTASSPTRAT